MPQPLTSSQQPGPSRTIAMGSWCSNPQDPDELVVEAEEWEVDMVIANNWWRGYPSPYVCTRCGAEWHRR